MTNVIDLDWERAKRIDDSLCVVEIKTDRHNPNRNFYRITGDREQDVQAEIDARTVEVESFGNGHATFYGPIQVDAGVWMALGEMVVRPDKWRLPGDE